MSGSGFPLVPTWRPPPGDLRHITTSAATLKVHVGINNDVVIPSEAGDIQCVISRHDRRTTRKARPSASMHRPAGVVHDDAATAEARPVSLLGSVICPDDMS